MCLMCTTLLLLDLLLTSPRPHSKLSAPLSPHSASSRTMDLSTTSSTYKAQHSLDQLTQSIRNANNLKAILQLSPQSETIIRTGPSLNLVRQPATSSEKQILPAASASCIIQSYSTNIGGCTACSSCNAAVLSLPGGRGVCVRRRAPFPPLGSKVLVKEYSFQVPCTGILG
mgnify:CR=1 FL=1